MPSLAILVAQCSHCRSRFWNEEAWKMHKEVCDKDPANLTAAEMMPGLVALTPAEMAERESVKDKPLHIDWQVINDEILQEECRDAIRAMETPKTTDVAPSPQPRKVRKKPAEDKPADLTAWT